MLKATPSAFPGMGGSHVRVRLPSAGTVAGDFVSRHPDARMACIEAARSQSPLGPVVEHLALLEGVRDDAVGGLLDAWRGTYGIPAQPQGTPFAVRLPLPLRHGLPEAVARLHELDLAGSQALGHVLHGEHCDFWIDCGSGEGALKLCDRARLHLPPGVGIVTVGEPARGDVECWAALRLALEVANPSPAH